MNVSFRSKMTPLNSSWSYQAKVCLKDYDLHPAFAMSYLRKVGDLLSLQSIMGHTDLAMTKRYVAYARRHQRPAC